VWRARGSLTETLGRARAGPGGPLRAVARLDRGHQRVDQRAGDGRDVLDRAVEGFAVDLDGLVNPASLRTNCRDAARISSSVAGGAKLKRGRILRHIPLF
jgi:hypothetical protein